GTMLTSVLCSAYKRGLKIFSNSTGVQTLSKVETNSSAGQSEGGSALFWTDIQTFLGNKSLMDEVFGPASLVVECARQDQMLQAADALEGKLTATIHATLEDLNSNLELIDRLTIKAGRLVWNGFPTGVEVSHAMTHGGPFPATSDGRSTSVGTRA